MSCCRSVSLLQPTSLKFQDFAEQVRDRAMLNYNYTFSEKEEVSDWLIIDWLGGLCLPCVKLFNKCTKHSRSSALPILRVEQYGVNNNNYVTR